MHIIRAQPEWPIILYNLRVYYSEIKNIYENHSIFKNVFVTLLYNTLWWRHLSWSALGFEFIYFKLSVFNSRSKNKDKFLFCLQFPVTQVCLLFWLRISGKINCQNILTFIWFNPRVSGLDWWKNLTGKCSNLFFYEDISHRFSNEKFCFFFPQINKMYLNFDLILIAK